MTARKTKRSHRPDPTVEIVCLLRFSDGHQLTGAEAKLLEQALREALSKALPAHRRVGLYVHRASDSEWTIAKG